MKILNTLILLILSINVFASEICKGPLEQIYDVTNDPYITTFHSNKKVAMIKPGFADKLNQSFENELKAKGIDVIILSDPTNSDKRVLKENSSYIYAPTYISRRKKSETMIDQINNRDDIIGKKKAKKRSDLKRKLKLTNEDSEYKVVLEDANSSNMKEFQEIFSQTVGKRKNGLNLATDELLNAFVDGTYKDAKVVKIIHSQDNIVGMTIFHEVDSGTTYKVARAAFFDEGDSVHKNSALGIRAFYEFSNYISEKKEVKMMSYGSDCSFYGEVCSVGLNRFKSSLGHGVFPSEFEDPSRFVKILNTSKFLERGGILFGYKSIDNTDEYVAHIFGELPRDNSMPKGIELVYHPEIPYN